MLLNPFVVQIPKIHYDRPSRHASLLYEVWLGESVNPSKQCSRRKYRQTFTTNFTFLSDFLDLFHSKECLLLIRTMYLCVCDLKNAGNLDEKR